MYLTSQLDFCTSAKPGHDSPVTIIKDRTRFTQRIKPRGDNLMRGNRRGKILRKIINPHAKHPTKNKNGKDKAQAWGKNSEEK